jgi:hypothetical protein
MVEFEVLGTGESIDPTNPSESLVQILYLIMGAAVLFMVIPIGQQLGTRINGALASLLGTDVGDNSSGTVFGGD